MWDNLEANIVESYLNKDTINIDQCLYCVFNIILYWKVNIKLNAFKNRYVFKHYIIILKDKFHILELCGMKHKHNSTYLCLLKVMPVILMIYFVIAAL